jgi:C-terminal processing protease CtpA/Prc
MMTQIGKPERKEILNKLAATVEKRFYDPKFDSAAWRAKVEQQGTPAVDAQSVDEFVLALDRLVRSVGTPDSGFFHESTRKKVPKGISARFQYCQPNECAPAYTQASEAGDVFLSKLADGVGWLKVTKFPGAVGVDIAKQIDDAITQLADCNRLIVDLRGNAGGGLAFLRVMSYLTPDRLPVGYSVTRARAQAGFAKESLAVFDKIPAKKAGLLLLALKFGFRDDSVSIFTEGLGPKPFHRRIAIVVDETTTGACERIAAFAKENGLATIVGTRTAGRLICSSTYKVGHGYFVRVPARAWYTWSGEMLEGRGVTPDVQTPVVHGQQDMAIDEAMGTLVHA